MFVWKNLRMGFEHGTYRDEAGPVTSGVCIMLFVGSILGMKTFHSS
jgi:hypothetical protein